MHGKQAYCPIDHPLPNIPYHGLPLDYDAHHNLQYTA